MDTPYDYGTSIRNSYARAKEGLNRSYSNPLGAYTTADVRDKALREQNTSLDQQMGLDLSNAAQQTSADKFNRQALVANFTQPRMYNSQSTVSQPFTGGDILSMGLSGLSGFLS